MNDVKLPYVPLDKMRTFNGELGSVISRHATARNARKADKAMQPCKRERASGSYYPSMVVVVTEPVKVGDRVWKSQIDEVKSYFAYGDGSF